MKCQGNPELVSAFIDDQLSGNEAASAAAHIESCPACSKLRDEYLMISQMFAEDTVEAPEGFAEGVMRRINASPATRKKSYWKRYGALAAVCAIVIIAGVSAGVLRGGGMKSTGSASGSTMNMAQAPSADSAPMDSAASEAPPEVYEYQMDGEASSGVSEEGPWLGVAKPDSGQGTDNSGLTDGTVPENDEKLQGMVGSPVGDLAKALETGEYSLYVTVKSLPQAEAQAQEAGVAYLLFITEDGREALIVSLTDFRDYLEASENVLFSAMGSVPEAPWVLITQTE